MAENGQPKTPSKAGESTLGLIGAIAGLAGNLIFGPDSVGIDFGAPFKAGAAMLKDKREQQSLLELLRGNPHTAPLAEIGPSLVEAGGLVNNPDILEHPQAQGLIKQFSMGGGDRNLVSPEMQQSPQATVASVLTPQASTAPDYTSQEFLTRSAALRPDLAEKIIASKASKDPNDQLKDMLQTILLGKQIQGFETPEQKREAQQEDRKTLLDAQDIRLGNRQERNQIRAQELNKQTKRETWTPKEDENYNLLNQSLDINHMLIDKVKRGETPNMATALLSGSQVGSALLQRLDPNTQQTLDQIQTARDLTGKIMGDVKAQSGAQYSAKELDWMQSALPSKFDTPEQLQRSLVSDALKKHWLLYNTVAAKVEKAGNLEPALERGITVQQLKAFSALKKQLKNVSKQGNAEDIFKNPKNYEYLSPLGMDYFINGQ